ncbi:MAG: hypothetical protein ACYCSA_09015 [Thermoplasmataceae archaeon]|jgi:hypothetical protein|nr:hypothetical protein [Candidatus Thermoplasmatota archaeon]
MRILIKIVVRVEMIADNMKIFMMSKMIVVNPFAPNLIQSNGHSGGDS